MFFILSKGVDVSYIKSSYFFLLPSSFIILGSQSSLLSLILDSVVPLFLRFTSVFLYLKNSGSSQYLNQVVEPVVKGTVEQLLLQFQEPSNVLVVYYVLSRSGKVYGEGFFLKPIQGPLSTSVTIFYNDFKKVFSTLKSVSGKKNWVFIK